MCVQVLQNLEARYTSETLGWAVILLTLIMLETGIPKVKPICSENGFSLIFIVTIYSGLVVLMFLSFIGLISSYLAARLSGAIVMSGHFVVPQLAALVLNEEVEAQRVYCRRMSPWKTRTEGMEDEYLRNLGYRALSPVAECISMEVERHLQKVKKLINHGKVASRLAEFIAGMIINTLSMSSPVAEVLYRRSGKLVSILLALIIVLTMVGFSKGWLHPSMVLPVLLLLSLFCLLAIIIVLNRGRCLLSGEVSRQLDEALESRTGSEGKSSISQYVKELIHKHGVFSCSLGLDTASLCCLLGLSHYCVVNRDLVKPVIIPSLLLALIIYSMIAWIIFM